ncbi:MAG: NHLP-related RiPP peptide [Xanthomonadales bacterium]|nr:NHLP-related RiPP peptide [Xanthomonadales bacterium]
MTAKKSGGAHPPLEPQVADRLLDLLSSDNSFRRLFKRDPHAALKEVGHELSPETTLTCMSVNRIATKQEIDAAREQIKSQITAQGMYNVPHCFEAGMIASTLKRR